MTEQLRFAHRAHKTMKVDLHIHTTASDGTWSPDKLMKYVIEAGIELFAVTDHDSTDNVAETALLAKEHGVDFIPGVEVNTYHDGLNYHILGLGIEPENRKLQTLLQKNKQLAAQRDHESIKRLEKKYPHISVTDYDKYINNHERGGWKALNYLIDKNLCTSYKDYFTLFEEQENPFKKQVFVAPGQAIETIRNAGGISVLAHPGASFYSKDYQKLISFMIKEGISGIECYHPDNSPEITRYARKICDEQNLLITGGSDCHGDFIAARFLGHPDIRFSSLKLEGINIS